MVTIDEGRGVSVELREDRPGDAAAIRALHRDAFGDHGVRVAELVDALRPGVRRSGLSLVAEHAERIVGHVVFSPSRVDTDRRLLECQVLSPVAVEPDIQGRGVGGAMIRHGLAVLADRGVPLVVLEGPPAYYGRFGFVPGRDIGLRRPSLRIPEAAFQAMRLPAYEPWMTGTLVYAEPFWDQDAVGLR